MFYFRINRLTIFENMEHRPVLGLFGPDTAQVQIVSFVTTGNVSLPNLDNFLATNDPTAKETILKEIVSHVVASRILTSIQDVRDRQIMTFGDTGYVLYEDPVIPDDFNWTFIAIDQRRNVREQGQIINAAINDPGFEDFTTNLGVLLTNVAKVTNPAYTAAVAVAGFITDVISSNLRKSGDREIGILYLSLNRAEHYLHGERKADSVPDLRNNMRVDYSIFGFDETAKASE